MRGRRWDWRYAVAGLAWGADRGGRHRPTPSRVDRIRHLPRRRVLFGVGSAIAVGAFPFPMSAWPVAVILVAAALGAWLMARTALSLCAAEADRERQAASTQRRPATELRP